MTKELLNLTIPHSLPLLESLCWNIANPYNLSLKEMLSIYETRWRFRGLFGRATKAELNFVYLLAQAYNRPSLLPEQMEIDKQQFYHKVRGIVNNLDSEILIEYQAYFGGGTMLSLERDCYRLSYDLDFLCNLDSFNRLRRWVDEGRVKELLKSDRLSIGEIKKDLYGIRMPLILDRELPPIKLEFIAENRFELNPCEIGELGLPLLNLTDRFTSKLLANADRYMDSSTHARDLIDLTILRLSKPIPTESILAAEANYRVRQPLIEAIVNFQNKPEWRASCYEALSVDNPVRIIDGLDELATDFEMEATERSFRETDFSYLETKQEKDPTEP